MVCKVVQNMKTNGARQQQVDMYQGMLKDLRQNTVSPRVLTFSVCKK